MQVTVRESGERFDVIVCGGGSAGFTSALAAAEGGAKVLLLERKHQLGGMGTSGLVSHWLGGRADNGSWKVGGIFRRFAEEAVARGFATLPNPADFAEVKYSPHGQFKGQLLVGMPYNPDAMAQFLEEKLLAAGVTLRYETALCAAEADSGRVRRIVTAAKDGLTAWEAPLYIDATGDADLAAYAGAGYVKGMEGDGFMSGGSLILHVDQVDEQALMEYIHRTDDLRFRAMLAQLRAEGEECFDYEIIIFVKMSRAGHFMVNGRGLAGLDGTDPASRTAAYVKDRARIQQTFDLFRRRFPGLANATLKAVASDLGVRETRRIDGMSRMTIADVQSARE